MTNGAAGVTDGDARAFRAAALANVAIIFAFAVVNALSVIADRPDIARWEPWSWEITSGLAAAALVWLPWLALRRAMPGQATWPRLVLTHGAAALVFSALHVAAFVLMREGIYALHGWDYDFGPVVERFPYELRKDLLTYLAFTAMFWIALKLRERPAVAAPSMFDIRDGSRIIRTPVGEVLAVTAAGNYAEFILADGRRPLMRTTLARLESELSAHGLVRVHRSWLVNPARVTGLEPDGSGDWTVELGEIRAPLSRRYPQALERLKG